jgi:uncharacterized protein (DUF488 family)
MKGESVGAQLTVFTVGHSNHPLAKLVDLLRQHRIELLVDVRSSPTARYATHFNRNDIERALHAEGIEYRFLGNLMGGKPKRAEFYDDRGFVLYDRLAESPEFQQGIDQVLEAGHSRRLALLCSEEDPTQCHRRLLIGRVLRKCGAALVHIREDGRLQTEEELIQDEQRREASGQMTLFDEEELYEWKSTRSVSPRGAQRSSSKRSSAQ